MMLSRSSPTAHFISTLGYTTHIDTGFTGRGFPIIQRGLKVVRKPQTETNKAALAYERP